MRRVLATPGKLLSILSRTNLSGKPVVRQKNWQFAVGRSDADLCLVGVLVVGGLPLLRGALWGRLLVVAVGRWLLLLLRRGVLALWGVLLLVVVVLQQNTPFNHAINTTAS